MTNSILVSYATRYGSTQEVAKVVAETIKKRGFSVELLPMRNVSNLHAYEAVVIGAPIYIGRWHEEMRKFLQTHQIWLQKLPVALFTLGPIHNEAQEIENAKLNVEQELATYNWVDPIEQVVFVGSYDPEKLNFAHKLLTKLPASPLHELPPVDERNWHAIRLWAEHLADKLWELHAEDVATPL